MINPFSLQNCQQVCHDCPENLFLFSPGTLEKRLSRGVESEKCCIIAELFVRAFLDGGRNEKVMSLIRQWLPNGEWEDFQATLSVDSWPADLDSVLWNAGNDFSRSCQTAVRRRFRLLMEAEGVIPVFYDATENLWCLGALIPFHFEDRKEQEIGVFDLDGQEVEEWSAYLKFLRIPQAVRLHCHLKKGVPLTGGSVMLPLQMAWWRKESHLPPYSVFRVLSTGRLDDQGTLQSVDVAKKIRTLSEQLQEYTLFYPENTHGTLVESYPNGEHCQLPCGATSKKILSMLQKKMDSFDCVNLKYSEKRHPAFIDEVRFYNCSEWRRLAERLENTARFDRTKYPEAYLANLMLQSEAYRHAGMTDKAEKRNGLARKFALEKGLQEPLLRLEIEHLVDLQDREKIALSVEYGKTLEESLKTQDKADLWMRYHGTMGQAYLYGSLAEVAGCSMLNAEKCFRDAVKYAREGGKNTDVAQDLNYLVLHAAFAYPGEYGMTEAYRNAEEQIRQLAEDARPRQSFFLKRYQALAWYRLLLENGVCPENYHSDAGFSRVFSPQGAEGWMRATIGKYLGALEASRGNRSKAEEYFKKAFEAIPANAESEILQLIRLTVCAEALRSLGEDSYYRQQAEELLKCPLLQDNPTFLHFKGYLHGEEEFPGLRYWY